MNGYAAVDRPRIRSLGPRQGQAAGAGEKVHGRDPMTLDRVRRSTDGVA